VSEMNSINFGTDGWRARMDESFTIPNVSLVAQAIANYLKRKKQTQNGIAIGFDTRRNSNMYAEEIARVLTGNNIRCLLDREDIPTPVLTYAIQKWKLDGAIMLTASHNPPEYNGLKFIPEYASPAMPDVTDAIMVEINRVMKNQAISKISLEEAKKTFLFSEIDPKQAYIEHVINLLDKTLIKKKKFTIIFDPLFGTARNYLPQILKQLGQDVTTLHDQLDPDFGGLSPNPSKKNLAMLERTVIEANADVGFACDGDGDRSGVVTEKGEFVRSHETFCILLKYLIERNQSGVIVKTIDTTSVLDKMVEAFGLELVEVPIGSKYIGEVMRTRNGLIGGEQSGGLMFRGHIAEKDGIYTNLKILEAIAYFDKPVSEIINDITREFGSINFDQLGVECSDEKKPEVMLKITSSLPDKLDNEKIVQVLDIDGLKLICEDKSWLLIRPSGTEPLLRISAEASSKEKAKKLTKIGKELIEGIIQ